MAKYRVVQVSETYAERFVVVEANDIQEAEFIAGSVKESDWTSTSESYETNYKTFLQFEHKQEFDEPVNV